MQELRRVVRPQHTWECVETRIVAARRPPGERAAAEPPERESEPEAGRPAAVSLMGGLGRGGGGWGVGEGGMKRRVEEGGGKEEGNEGWGGVWGVDGWGRGFVGRLWAGVQVPVRGVGGGGRAGVSLTGPGCRKGFP